MGSGLSCFRGKADGNAALAEKSNPPARPHNGHISNGDAFDPEKRSVGYPASHAGTRRIADGDGGYQAEQRREPSSRSTQASDLTAAATLNGTVKDSKLKEDGVDDPEARERARKAEEARIKAEKEEQERLDFLQWM